MDQLVDVKISSEIFKRSAERTRFIKHSMERWREDFPSGSPVPLDEVVNVLMRYRMTLNSVPHVLIPESLNRPEPCMTPVTRGSV